MSHNGTRLSGSYSDIRTFAIKTCIAAIVTVAAINWIVDSALQSFEESLTRTMIKFQSSISQTQIGGRQFWSKVEKGLDEAAASNLPEDKRGKLLHDLQVIVVRWRPFIETVQVGLKGPPPK